MLHAADNRVLCRLWMQGFSRGNPDGMVCTIRISCSQWDIYVLVDTTLESGITNT